jgi:hypothetical protein
MRKHKHLAAKKAHELSVELSSGETISQSVMSTIQFNVKPVTEGFEANEAEGMFPPMPNVEIVD